MTDNTRDVIYNALRLLLRDGIMEVAFKEVLAAKGLVIQSADEADARVAAAERKGMERAAVIADRAAEEIDRDRGLSADSAIAAGIAVTIRADRGA